MSGEIEFECLSCGHKNTVPNYNKWPAGTVKITKDACKVCKVKKHPRIKFYDKEGNKLPFSMSYQINTQVIIARTPEQVRRCELYLSCFGKAYAEFVREGMDPDEAEVEATYTAEEAMGAE